MKKQVQIVAHPIPVHAENIVDVIKEYWGQEQYWKNPGYHYIVGARGKIEKLLLEKNGNMVVKGHKRNAIHFSFVQGDNKRVQAVERRTKLQVKAFMGKLRELNITYPKACIVLEFEVSEK